MDGIVPSSGPLKSSWAVQALEAAREAVLPAVIAFLTRPSDRVRRGDTGRVPPKRAVL